MQTYVADRNVVGETESTLFDIFQNGLVAGFVTIQNDGVNPIDYRFQSYVSGAWSDLDDSGTDLHNTLASGDSLAIKLTAEITASSKVRLLGSADGGSILSFSLSRYFTRESGGAVPILSL